MMIVCKPSENEVAGVVFFLLAAPVLTYVFWKEDFPFFLLVITGLLLVSIPFLVIVAACKTCIYSEQGITVKILCFSYNVSWADIAVIKRDPQCIITSRYKSHGASYGDVVIFSKKALPRNGTRLSELQFERPFSLFFVTFTPEKNLITKETKYYYICEKGYDEFSFIKNPPYHVDKEQFLNALSAWGIDIPME